MATSTAVEYANTLASLEGNEFQAEVSIYFGTQIIGFQTVPDKPQGDGGLDGFSHNGERGYCCYGLEHDVFKTAKERVDAIVVKFSKDLRRLFELGFDGKKLVKVDDSVLKTILPKDRKLEHIYLIVNWFEDHRILGRIGTAVQTYKAASECRYVASSVTVVVIGPTELSALYSVTESAVYRVQQRVFVQKVKQTAKTVVIGNPADFEAKMQILREIRPDMLPTIEQWSAHLLENWRMALAFEIELDKTLNMLHQSLEDCRRRIAVRVAELALSSTEQWKELGKAHELALEILGRDFGEHGPLLSDVSSGEIARLVGECPINWTKPVNNA